MLVTTRRPGYVELGEVVDLDVMLPGEAVDLLTRRAPCLATDPATAAEIAEELGYLPLALDQAAAYLDRTGIAPIEWLRLWRGRVTGLPRPGSPGVSPGHDRHIVVAEPGTPAGQ